MRLRHFIIPLLAPVLLFLSCGSDDQPINTPAVNFETFWSTIDQHYPYFELKGVDWDAVKDEFEPQVSDQLTNRQLFDIFSQMILRLEDGHTGIKSSFATRFHSLDPGTVDNSAVNPEQYVSVTQRNNRYTIGKLRDKNVGYLAIGSLSGITESPEYQALYQSVNTFNSYDGLIIDLRNNGGGNDGIAQRFVQSFSGENVVFRRVRFREQNGRNSFTAWQESRLRPDNAINFNKPIIVLTNRGVVSSAEGFTLMLKALSNVTIIGDTTAGSTGNPGRFNLPNDWELSVSRWQVTDPEGNYIEDQGIAPDKVIWISEADRNAGKDTILEAAIASFD